MPPATATLRSPARMDWSTIPAERIPDAQTLLTVSEETSFGIPPLICAWRLGIWPWPAWSTWPKTTCSTCSGDTSARSSAAAIAVPPRSVASSEASAPPIFPNGVRAAPRITVFGMSKNAIDWVQRSYARRGRSRDGRCRDAPASGHGERSGSRHHLLLRADPARRDHHERARARHERGLLGRHVCRAARHVHPDRGPVPALPLHQLERLRRGGAADRRAL